LNNPLRLTDPTGKVAQVAVNEKKKTITITINVDCFGDGDQQTANEIADDIESAWNGEDGQSYVDPNSGEEYSVTVEVNARHVGESVSGASADNKIELKADLATASALGV
jgi:hypothetical protein